MLCAAFIMVLALSGASGQALVSAKAAHSSQTSATTASYPVKVFFSKTPESDNDLGAVLPADRISPTLGVATFAESPSPRLAANDVPVADIKTPVLGSTGAPQPGAVDRSRARWAS